jgi:membrane fusion protein (multidrug efflux system)
MKKLPIYLIYAGVLYFASCAGKANQQAPPPPPTLPVVTLQTGSTVTWQTYPATVEGTTNVDIRPQVSGYLEKSFVQDGAWVNEGQPLFRINAKEYSQYSKTADANILLAKANIEKAQVEVDRLAPLVTGKVISDVQLKTAKAVLGEAQANYSQAVSGKSSAEITLGYTLITAPVSGYVGHINFKEGSLIGKGETLPLTSLTAVDNVHAYFSMSEADFLQFFSHVPGASVEEKIKGLPPVELALADNTIYAEKGTVQLVQGQFNRTSGSIAFRALFPNRQKLLRSGISGRIRIPFYQENKLLVPQQSTFELQDKIFVFALGDSNKVSGKQIIVAGKSGNNYVVEKGVNAGESIVFSGIQRLRDGAVIIPQRISADSALASH